MTYDLAAVLRAEGLSVEVEPGAERRSNGQEWGDRVGLLVHHTAIGPKASDAGVDKILRDGRPKTSSSKGLPGPLCQIRLKRNGVVRVIAYGPANHAGAGRKKVLAAMRLGKDPGPHASGKDDLAGASRLLLGVECDNDGVGEGWSRQQVAALEKIGIALCRAEGWNENHVVGHAEWTSRKVDPRGINMASLRVVIAHGLSGTPHAQQPKPPAKTAARPTPSWEEAAVNSLPTLGKGAGRNGSENGWVRRIQGLLVASGQTVTVDGQFGSTTERSVKAFQKRAGIAQDGIVGRGTWQRLMGL